MTEQTLREQLRQRAEEAPDRPLDYAGIWDAAVRKRRRRTRRTTTAVVISGMAIVGLSALWGGNLMDGPTPDHPTGQHHKNPDDGKAETPLEEWVASLPVGEPPAKPYLQGSILHDGDVEWSVPEQSYQVLDRVPGGYLVASNHDRDYEQRFGVRGQNGDVFWLGSPEFDPLEVLSTDHTHLAVVAGSDIRLYDLEQRSEIASLQADGYVEPIQLVDAGLIYAVYNNGPNRQVYLWNPDQGGSPEVLQYLPAMVSDDMTRAIVSSSKNECRRAVEIAGADVTRYLFNSCWPQRIDTISPDGTHALTTNRKVVDLDSGQVSPFEDAPNRGPVMPYVVWEDSEHVLLRLPLNTGSRLYGKATTVRCSVNDLTCERIPQADGPSIRVLDATRTP